MNLVLKPYYENYQSLLFYEELDKVKFFLMPRSHIHVSPRRFYYGLNPTDDPGNANFRSPIRVHYIRMIKYYYVCLRMQYGKLRTNTDCHECCRIVSVANPASSPWMCDLGISDQYLCYYNSFNNIGYFIFLIEESKHKKTCF